MFPRLHRLLGLFPSWIGAAALALGLVGLPGALSAQEASDDVLVIEEGDEGRGSFAEKHVFGSIGGNVFFGSPISRDFVAARLGIDYPFATSVGSGKIYLEGGYSRRSVSLEQKRSDDALLQWDPNTNRYVSRAGDLPATRELEVTASGAEIREAYLQYDPADYLSLSVGYQRPIWGQFDIVSPVNLLLPLEFQSDDPSFDKSSFRMPQPAVSATVFPFERLEVSAYWFPGTNLDPLHQEILDEAGPNTVYVAGDEFGATETRPRPREDASDYDAYAARAVWYGDALILGLTYFEGRNTLFTFDALPLVPAPVLQEEGGTSYDAYSVIDRSALPSSRAVGVELAVPVGRYTYTVEAFNMMTEADIGALRREIIPQGATDARSQATRELYQWIVNENGGRGYVDVELYMAGAGFDALYDHWRFGASGFVVGTSLSGEASEADRLVQAAYSEDDDSVGFSSEFLPNAYLFYDFDEERTETIGFVGGFAGPLFGLSTFYTGTWLDNLRYTASLEYAVVLSDLLLDELNSESGAYELESAASFGARFGVLYEF